MRRLFRNFQFFVQASLVIFGSPQIARAVPFDVEAAKIAGLEAKAPASGSFTEFEEVSRQSKRGDTPLAARIEKLIQSVREAAEEKHIRFTQGGVQEVPDIPNKHGHFELVVGPFSLDSGQAQVAMWRSKVTRLTFVWIGTNSLLLEGALTLATEVFDHSGAPHALEHLVFHGSHKYPHKGTLHSLSASGLGQASTATTALTYTSYHMESVTAEGFLRTLPVYLEHVFFPTLSPLAFTTEIHHIDKDGKDAGTVYSEMQGYENSAEDLIQRCIRRELFPEHSAYRSTTGGLLDGLRTLDIKKIQDYHTAYYHPQNLQVCVTGHMDPKAVLSVLQEKVEPRLIEEGRALPQKNWKRPFLETASQGGPRLTNTRSVEIEFPAVDEVSGVVLISWVGAPVTVSH